MRRELTGAEIKKLSSEAGRAGMALTCEGDCGTGPCGQPADWTDGTCSNGHMIEIVTDDESAFPAQSMVGQYVYIRRTKREAGLLNSGMVTGVDRFGRLLIDTRIGVLALSMFDVTTDINEA